MDARSAEYVVASYATSACAATEGVAAGFAFAASSVSGVVNITVSCCHDRRTAVATLQ